MPQNQQYSTNKKRLLIKGKNIKEPSVNRNIRERSRIFPLLTLLCVQGLLYRLQCFSKIINTKKFMTSG